MLGYLYWRWKRYSEAVEPLQVETRISPNLAEPYFYLGDIALRNKQFVPAENYFRTALRLKPAYGEADLDMGRALAESGHYQDAIPFMRLAVEKMPDREETHYWLGKTLIQAGQKAEGEKELAEVEKLNKVKRQTASEILNQVVSPTAADSHKTP
jgi:tetratricopeptide (TPR) repeat protein